MPELTCVPAPNCSKSSITFGTLIASDPDLKISHDDQTFVHVYNMMDDVNIVKLGNHWQNSQAKAVTLSLIEAYQLRDFLNKNLDDLAWSLAESYNLSEKMCKALAKFKKVYYEDEINNTETNNPEAEETEAKVSE